VVLALAAPAAHVLGSRLRPIVAVPIGALLILVAAAPVNTGEGVGALSFAMFYNRIGWAALGLLLVMHLRPRSPAPRQTALDALCAAGLVLSMLYTKATYGVVGLGFLALMLLDPRQRGWALAALGLTAASALAVEAAWGGTAGHVADLRLAVAVSGASKPLDQLVQPFLVNSADYAVFGLIAGLALWRSRRIRDGLFFGFCAGAGYVLIVQNFQHGGVVTLHAGAAVAAEILLRRREATPSGSASRLEDGAPVLLMALVLPMAVQLAAVLALHAGLAASRRGEPAPLARFEEIRLVRLWSEGAYSGFKRYFASLEDGARALQALGARPGEVLVLDFVGPFSAGLGLPPPTGDSTWHHWGRTLDEAHHLPAERLFRDVDVVMDPKQPIEFWTADGMRRVYADHLAEHFELARETADWRIYVRRGAPVETVRGRGEPQFGG